jgi:hypothetical protein
VRGANPPPSIFIITDLEVFVARTQLQIDITTEARDHLKSLAYSKGLTLKEYVLKAVAEMGDAKARKLIEASLSVKRTKSISTQIHK